jgi:glycerol kinase
VEHDAEDIWRDTLAVTQGALEKRAFPRADIAAIGITNQRETVVLWDRATGRPLHRAIVWQDRRTAAACAALRAQGHEPLVQARTGLLLDPYFSATKLAWLLDTIPGARTRAEQGELAFGTIDSFLLWRLTEGREHKTDITNASRTLLFDIASSAGAPICWRCSHPRRHPAASVRQRGRFWRNAPVWRAHPHPRHRGRPAGRADRARLPGPGEAKITYGTGGFMLMNTGTAITRSRSRLLTTMAYRMDGATHYAMEGSLFVAGAAIKWLRDGLGIIVEARQTQAMAAQLPSNGGVYMVPAFVGLGAPHWCTEARGMLTGLTFDSGPAHIARAALESVAFQTADLVAAMQADGAGTWPACGWMAAWRPTTGSASSLPIFWPSPWSGPPIWKPPRWAPMLAAHASRAWPDALTRPPEAATRFAPRMAEAERARLTGEWRAAIRRATLV